MDLGFSTEQILLMIAFASGLYMAWAIGVNDVANAIGTSVGSGTLTLKRAVMVAAVMEFCGAFFFGSHVSETIQTRIVSPTAFSDPLILVYGMLSALLAAGIWLQFASYFGLPVSTTHSIVGSLIGFTLVSVGSEAVNWNTVGWIVSSWIFSPLMGALCAYGIFNLLRRQIFYTRNPVESAKRVAPRIIFGAIVVLTLFLLNEGLSNLHLNLSFWQMMAISLGMATVVATGSHFWIQRIGVAPARAKKELPYGPEIAVELDKARVHLMRVQKTTNNEAHYSVSHIIEELNNLSETMRQVPTDQNSEYAAVEKIFGFLQVLSASLMAFAHGANDVANAIGPLAAAVTILTTGTVAFSSTIPAWLLGLGGVGIVIGLMTWGWRVIETIGKKLTELTPSRGFSAEFGAAMTIVFASGWGMPISTTHTLVGAVLGVACARGIGALNLGMTRDILISWIVTVPAGAGIAIVIFYGFKAIFGG